MRLARAVALAFGLGGGASAVAAAPAAWRQPADPDFRAALDLVYDGAFTAAEARLAMLAEGQPDDPLAPYLQGLALQWRLEQDASSRVLDPEVLRLADLALARAKQRLGRDPRDARGLLARGAAHGLKSRLHLFRWEKSAAAREATRMRAALLVAREQGVDAGDADFGLGLYDYYAETLPRFFRLLRFLAGIPAGDRERGRAAIARAARGSAFFHDTEARVQMFDIHSFFERKPDRALPWILEMRRRYPGWPLWGLKLSELLREPLGLFTESAAVAREILVTAETGRHVNYQPVVAAMARVTLGEALLLDLRPAEARAAAASACRGTPEADWVAPRAELVVGRSLEIEGDRTAALPHYRRAAEGRDHRAARAARAALERPLTAGQTRALALLGQSRRLLEEGREHEARRACLSAFQADPTSTEGRLCAAQESLAAGRTPAARALVRDLAAGDGPAPPWLRPAARLLLAEVLEREGDRAQALVAYKKVWEEPYGHPQRRAHAAEALRRLDPATPVPEVPPFEQ